MKINTCPFCGGSARLSFRETDYVGRNFRGDKKSKYIFQVVCNRCHSRGKPVKTDYLINANPWASLWNSTFDVETKAVINRTEEYRPWADKAIEAWNRRQ